MKFLREAAQLISDDNNGSCVGGSVEEAMWEVHIRFSLDQVMQVEKFLRSLTKEEFETVCIGEMTEMQTIIDKHGMGLANRMLNFIFEGE